MGVKVFFDITIGGADAGRITMEVFGKEIDGFEGDGFWGGGEGR